MFASCILHGWLQDGEDSPKAISLVFLKEISGSIAVLYPIGKEKLVGPVSSFASAEFLVLQCNSRVHVPRTVQRQYFSLLVCTTARGCNMTIKPASVCRTIVLI